MALVGRWRELVAPVSVAALGAALLAGCGTSEANAPLVGYRPPVPGSSELVVLYSRGPSDGLGHADVLKQDSKTIQVRVRFKQSNGTSDLVAEINETTAVLKEPPGSREVLDASGEPIPLKSINDYPRVSNQ
ncbi:hypothetical protein ACTOB_007075 [Actinoplanes oblitus]|uniref:Uncharacterized protein n=1 Tax=Actinoplanes oblitus TaxID=3040509 RepID=A0ABY8WAX5_9ACTN|nr:hypothetical protein [Actinoplanes oblitus]WIM95014.1 hypothetical protein ACTOB_007075 [Actinoplanes oblitus]